MAESTLFRPRYNLNDVTFQQAYEMYKLSELGQDPYADLVAAPGRNIELFIFLSKGISMEVNNWIATIVSLPFGRYSRIKRHEVRN